MLGAAALAAAAVTANAQVVGIATNAQGSLYYSVGSAVAAVMQQKAGIQARVQPTSGSSAYAPLVNRGEIEFGLMNSIDVLNAITGVENFKGRKLPDIRLVGAMFLIPVGMGVPNDHPAKSVKDLKGLRVPSTFTSQTTIIMVQGAVLASGDIAERDMKPFPVPDYVKGMRALGEGKVDTAMFGLGTGAAQEVHVALASRGGLRFLPIDTSPEGIARMKKVMPTAFPKTYQPSPGYPGIVGPTTIMAYSSFLVASTNVSDDMVYKATKALYENKPMLESTSATLKSFEPREMAEPSDAIYHPGAIKFYKEVGLWPPKK